MIQASAITNARASSLTAVTTAPILHDFYTLPTYTLALLPMDQQDEYDYVHSDHTAGLVRCEAVVSGRGHGNRILRRKLSHTTRSIMDVAISWASHHLHSLRFSAHRDKGAGDPRGVLLKVMASDDERWDFLWCCGGYCCVMWCS